MKVFLALLLALAAQSGLAHHSALHFGGSAPQLLEPEATANLDDEAAARAVELLTAQAAKHGATLVFATHDARVKRHFDKRLELPV